MKIIALVSAALLVAGLAVAKAEQPSQASAKSAPAKVKVQTGSKIPRTVALNGRITDGPYQLVVVTEENIRRSGSSTVLQALTRQGLRR